MTRTVVVVPHSHWDREWYAPFEAYRHRLVAMMDGLIDLLESEAGFVHFHLDGQVAMVDDYLELRPDRRDALEALVRAGRLSLGPWYVLMDEFCVSAETIVRNLQMGLERAAVFGAAEAVGYLPDMFGHVAQMPQLLRQAGIDHAVVWRGVPAAIRSTAFWWEGPDGSRCRAEYLPVGYAAGGSLPKDPADLLRRIETLEIELAPFLDPGRPLLLPNGGDHQHPQHWLPSVLVAANAMTERFRFEQSSLAAYLGAAPVDGLAEWHGELRSGARAPLLMGVLSNRVDVKQAAAAAEGLLERQAEPLAALWLPPDLYPRHELDRAWKEMVRNSAHDSSCACSADEVVRAVLARYDTARALAGSARDEACSIATVAVAAPGPVVLNSLPFPRGGTVELDLPGDSVPPGAQPVRAETAATEERSGHGRDLARLLGGLAADGWLGPHGRPVEARIDDPAGPGTPGGWTLVLGSDASRAADPATAPVMAEAWARAGAGRDEPLTVRVERRASQRVAVRFDGVPGWGWQAWPAATASDRPPVSATGPAGDGSIRLTNGLAEVVVDAGTGCFSLDGVAGQNRIVEEADGGDTYNFSAVEGDTGVGAPERVELALIEAGPVRARVRVRRLYRWPRSLGPSGRREGRVEVEIVSDIEMQAGERAVRIRTSFDHGCRDHRVRALFPLARAVTATDAECAFAAVTRTGAEGGPLEPPLATFPSRRFVTAGDLTVAHRGLLEYELIEGGRALALTLLRATGVISRPCPPGRPNVAGPALAVPAAQMPGPQSFDYALARHVPDRWRLADELWTPLAVVASKGVGHLPPTGSRLEVRGAQVSSLRRTASGVVEIRFYNPGPGPAHVEIPGRTGSLVDLRGRPTGRWSGAFVLRPWQIATARLDPGPLTGD